MDRAGSCPALLVTGAYFAELALDDDRERRHWLNRQDVAGLGLLAT